MAMATEWEQWCRRHGVDPNTPDETVLDDYLHGRLPWRSGRAQWRDAAQCEYYHSWDAYDLAMAGRRPEVQRVQAKAEVYELERLLRMVDTPR